MNAGELLRQYERFSDAPGAVIRLRRFVLDLALRGKLVDQCGADERASQLLGRIASEKARRGAAGLIRPPKPVRPVVDEPFELPDNWCWTQLAEIGLISPRNDAPDDAMASFVPMTLVAAEYGVKHGHEIRPWGEIKKGYTHFAEEDVGLAKITPCFENGKSTVFRGLANGIGSGTTELHIVRPVLVSPDFIVLVLKSPYFIENGIPRMTGTAGQKRVPTEYFANSPFPLPPIAEQHRIVAKVDELMALCDRLEATRAEREAARDRLTAASLARLNAPDPETFREDARCVLDALPAITARADQIKQLRQAIVNLAVRGKLVAQESGEIHGFDNLTSDTEAPADLPNGWQFMRLDSLLAEETRNGYSRRPDDAVGGTPILRISAGTVRRDGVVAEEEHKLISGIDSLTRQQYAVRTGDLLACRFNGNKEFVGRLTIFKDYLGLKPIYPDKLIRIRVAPDRVVPEFLRLLGDSDLVRCQIEAVCATTVGNWGVSAANLKEVRFPIPSLSVQRGIVSKVSELMAICDRLEASLVNGTEQRRRLLDALLHKALAPAVELEEVA